MAESVRSSEWARGGVIRLGVLVAICLCLGPASSRAEETARLTIQFSGLDETGGALLISVANSRAMFESEDEAFRHAQVPVDGWMESATFEGVPPGEYAVKVFHDANSNQELDIGWMGPTEKYGFSNNVVGLLGLPDWDDAKFRFEGGALTVRIDAR